MKIAIIDYGSGNLRSAQKAFEHVAADIAPAAEILVTARADEVASADRVVLPGVGAFADCASGLGALDGMEEALQTGVAAGGKPFLGICVGMQLLATTGHERTRTPGLNWLPGQVARLEPDDPSLKIPHMGWNALDVTSGHPVLAELDGQSVYFVHSYAFRAEKDGLCLATTDYGGDVCAVIGRDNIIGTQFHPEKSQRAGLRLIRNFLEWRP